MDLIPGEDEVREAFARALPRGAAGILIVLAAIAAAGGGCLFGRQAVPPQERSSWSDSPPAPPAQPTGEQAPQKADAGERAPGAVETPDAEKIPAAGREAPPEAAQAAPEPTPEKEIAAPAPEEPEIRAMDETVAPDEAATPSMRAAVPRQTPRPSHPAALDEPPWARGSEELVYRVEFLGMTMGYARFTYKGKVSWNGKEAYHLSVRAWTTSVLSIIYPIDDTIDYYLDMKTLAPLRQEYTGRVKGKDDIAVFDQEKGRIVYRRKSTGEIRKQVEAPVNVYDPVTAAYYFRARGVGAEDRPRNVYAGRKLYQISARTLGRERIDTPSGPMETLVIQPVIMRDGKLEDKGDLKMWMTSDPRHVPVKIYAKFRKVRMWTLVAELVPPRGGG